MNKNMTKNMTIAQIMRKMISFSRGNIHDIDHFIRVWTYARTIGELENLAAETQTVSIRKKRDRNW